MSCVHFKCSICVHDGPEGTRLHPYGSDATMLAVENRNNRVFCAVVLTRQSPLVDF